MKKAVEVEQGIQPNARRVSTLPRRTFLGALAGVLCGCWGLSCPSGALSLSVGAARLARFRHRVPANIIQMPESRVELDSSDARLKEGFGWAKQQALAYVFVGDPVGPWYEAALPGRQAFCMRDVSHQSNGAQILGLAAFNENMLRKFAENISASRDWCSYWEINKNNVPAPVDYVNEHDFWYNLPANFDVLSACYRQYLWTGRSAYLDPVFMNFYRRSVTDYVKKWDINGDGLLEHLPQYGHRGIASYDEHHIGQMRVAADLLAAQYAAYRSYAQIQIWQGNASLAQEFSLKADHLKLMYNQAWWSDTRDGFFAAIGNDGQFNLDPKPGSEGVNILFPLYCELVDAGHKTEAALNALLQQFPADNNSSGGVEERSYVPEILFRYGRSEPAYQTLLGLMDPSLKRREYPEVSFAAIGACANGLAGLKANSTTKEVETFPQLHTTDWVELKHVPVFDNQISIRHQANRKTIFANESGVALHWRASFPGRFEKLRVDGGVMPAQTGHRLGDAAESWVVLSVSPSETKTAEVSS